MATDLDPTSAIELLRLCEEEFSESRYEREVQFQRDYSPAPDFCREHTDEMLAYFCFECETECICAECAIHGEHKGHEVMQIKKAFPIIKDKLEEVFLHVSNKIDEVELRAEKVENQKKELIDQGNAAKQQVIVSFEDLRARLEKKEREIISQIERIVQENLREADNYSRIIIGKIGALESVADTLKKVMSGGQQTELLDFYAENKEKIFANVESELATLGNIDRSTSLRCVITPQSLGEHIDSIKAVQLQISALKYIEDPVLSRQSEKSRRINIKTNS